MIESVSISQIGMGPIEYIVQGTTNKNDQHPTNDGFIELYNYFTLNPVGIAEWSIIFTGPISLLFPNERIQSYRFEIEAGNKYSLTNAFKFNRITEIPKEIFIAMSYKTTGESR